jgi:small-conductance mechanosensitive channel
MRRYEKFTLILLLVLTAAASAAVLLTHGWADYRQRFRASQTSRRSNALVDTSALDTAQTLAPLAVTRRERDYASDALRLGDYSVDLGFSIAMQDAANHPATLTPAVKAIAEHLKKALVTGFTAQLATANAAQKDRLQATLGIVQTQLSLDQDDAQDAQQQLIRSGGDKQATIQQLLDQHEASETHTDKSAASDVGSSTVSPESTAAHNMVAESRALISLRAKENQLLQAQQDAQNRSADLVKAHGALQQAMETEKAQSTGANGLAALTQLSLDQKELAALAKRLDTEQQLATGYANWAAFVSAREKSFWHELFVAALWILVVALCAWGANYLVQRAFSRVALERRQMHTIRALTLVFVQAAALLVAFLIVFGMPSNLATVLALATAGLTVALKDFIVAFLGWLILMRKDGIRPGDWVEINGVGGEVVDVGVMHTILLESGTGADAGHPTGRKVSFMNGYAIEGHYFNFSTSGQWMWDEIEVQVPDATAPYTTAEAVLKIVEAETAENAQEAESEWSRSTRYYAQRSFSAKPTMGVKPSGGGVIVTVRYIARAPERYETRAKIYRAVVELLHNRQAPDTTLPASSPVASGKA